VISASTLRDRLSAAGGLSGAYLRGGAVSVSALCL